MRYGKSQLDEDEIRDRVRAGLAISKFRDQAIEQATRLIPPRLQSSHRVNVFIRLVPKDNPPPEKTLRDLFAHLPKPQWLPIYDIDAFLQKFDSELPYPGSYASMAPMTKRRFEEYRALIEICEMANGGLSTEVSRARINEALETNARDGYPNYKRLLELLRQSFGADRLPR